MADLIAIYRASLATHGSLTIGRGEGHDICVLDPWVSRQGHARIEHAEAGECELHDLGSRNGTYLNGRRVREAVVLRHGDIIRCGNSLFIFEADEGERAERGLSGETVCQGPGDFARPSQEAFARLLAEYQALRADLEHIRSETEADSALRGSLATGAFHDELSRAAASEATVLLEGETGTGKEVVARELHRLSPRADRRFVPVNCAALPPTMVESELFGHRKGAFTGADEDRAGRFRTADGGTIFLDEIAELPLAVQAKLLRVLESGEVQPVGSDDVLTVGVRLIAATNHDLEADVQEGRFRSDLFHRLNVLAFELPPLRERLDDVEALAEEFLGRLRSQRPTRAARLTADALALLRAYPWPGNVRELRNAIERAAIMAEGDEIGDDDLAFLLRRAGVPAEEDEPTLSLRETEKKAVQQALLVARGNKSEAARLLGIDRTTLYDKIKAYGLSG